ncbi:MAG TPA: hypothetical protein VLA19_10805 [Herpetosiphonaceae bacterium]|nr:hypothetical protein [Herpetosiphonaceae bacterium]
MLHDEPGNDERDQVLVLSATEAYPVAITADAGVVVEGTVRKFDRDALEKELGVELDENVFSPFEGRMAIVATTVVENMSASTTATPGVEETTTAVAMGADPATEGNVTVAEIAGNLDAFDGREVTVFEEVEEVIGKNAFTLDEDAALEGGIDSDVLVIVDDNEGTAVDDGDLMKVTGTVRRFDMAEVEKAAGFDLDDSQYTDWAGRPAIVAQEIEAISDWPSVSSPPPNPGITEEFGRNITVAEIASNPTKFISQTVTVREEVEEVIHTGVFSLDEDAPLEGGIDTDLLVITMPQRGGEAGTATPMGTAQATMEAGASTDTTATGIIIIEAHEGELVEVTGMVRNLVIAEVEREFGLDFDDELVMDFKDRPVIVASQVRLVPPDTGDSAAEAGAGTGNVAVADITSNLTNYTGKQVAVRGEVEEIFGNTAFSIDEDAVTDGGIDDELLVVSALEAAPFTAEELEERRATVHGTVRAFDLQSFEKELGYDLDDNRFRDWAGRPAIIASAVDVRE